MTENEGLAVDGGSVIDNIARVLLIVLVALILKWLFNRFIARVIKQVTSSRRPQSIAELNSILGSSKSRREEIVGNRTQQRSATLTSVLQHINGIVVWSIAIMLILSTFEVNLAPILASAGIAGVAIGFGAQNLVQDYLAGIFILVEDQYGVGDVIDAGDAFGTVEDMGLRITTIRDLSGTLWYVRNGQIQRVGNTSQSWAFVVIDTPLPPSVDVDRAARIITEAAEAFAEDEQWRPHILEAPGYLGVPEMTIDHVKLRLGVKTASDQQWAAGRELRRRISEALLDAGISSANAGTRVYVPRGSTSEAQA